MYSVRSSQINPFTVMQLLQRAQEFEAEGKRVVHFEVGEPDFVTAEPIVAAGIEALQQGKTKYTSAQGVLPLREKFQSITPTKAWMLLFREYKSPAVPAADWYYWLGCCWTLVT